MTSQSGDLLGYLFWCPACEEPHPFHVGGERTFIAVKRAEGKRLVYRATGTD